MHTLHIRAACSAVQKRLSHTRTARVYSVVIKMMQVKRAVLYCYMKLKAVWIQRLEHTNLNKCVGLLSVQFVSKIDSIGSVDVVDVAHQFGKTFVDVIFSAPSL